MFLWLSLPGKICFGSSYYFCTGNMPNSERNWRTLVWNSTPSSRDTCCLSQVNLIPPYRLFYQALQTYMCWCGKKWVTHQCHPTSNFFQKRANIVAVPDSLFLSLLRSSQQKMRQPEGTVKVTFLLMCPLTVADAAFRIGSLQLLVQLVQDY